MKMQSNDLQLSQGKHVAKVTSDFVTGVASLNNVHSVA